MKHKESRSPHKSDRRRKIRFPKLSKIALSEIACVAVAFLFVVALLAIHIALVSV